jgi:hypothetical protein
MSLCKRFEGSERFGRLLILVGWIRFFNGDCGFTFREFVAEKLFNELQIRGDS